MIPTPTQFLIMILTPQPMQRYPTNSSYYPIHAIDDGTVLVASFLF
jgi:hypothetical protein